MAKKKIGYVELQWECPNCGTVNPGPVKVCEGCGAPQPEDVKFQQASRQELIEDEDKIKKAKTGADIHCAYCGARNPADAAFCSQCKADLSEGAQRKAGRVVGVFQQGAPQTIPCPHCGAENEETTSWCAQCGGSLAEVPAPAPVQKASPTAKPGANRRVLAILGVVFVSLCAAVYFLFLRTNAVTGTVTDLQWERSAILEQVVPVEYQGWLAEIPEDGEIVSCTQEEYEQVETPVAGAQEICGTPYNVDTGSGYAEVVQDCLYIVYEDYCTYTVMEWDAVEMVAADGSGMNAAWPQMNLAQDQRLQEGEETYTIVFNSGGETYSFVTSDYDLYRRAEIGSKWELEINSIGGVQSIKQGN